MILYLGAKCNKNENNFQKVGRIVDLKEKWRDIFEKNIA